MHMLNILSNDTSQLTNLLKSTDSHFEQKVLNTIKTVSNQKVYRKRKTDQNVIQLASYISNMEIMLSEAGVSFTLNELRTQPNYGASEITWVVKKLRPHIDDPLLRKAVTHLITGSEMTMNRDIFIEVLKASVFIVNHLISITHLIGYAIAFDCKSIYELSNKFNFHIVKQDYSQPYVRWFYNGTSHVQQTEV